MTISIELSLAHMDWAEQVFYAQLAEIPTELFAAHYGNPEWTVSIMAQHIANGAQWYEYCLTGVRVPTPAAPHSADDVMALRTFLHDRAQILIAQASEAEDYLHVDEGDGTFFDVLRSTLLVQAVQHSVEHRAQIACALEANGYRGINLDDIDAWAFAAAQRA